MESSEDKQWASKYLLDPLTAPEPSEETGPGTHHIANGTTTASSQGSLSRKPVASASVRSVSRSEHDTSKHAVRSSNNPYRGNFTPSTSTSGSGYPTPPSSGSPQTERFPDFSGIYTYTPSNRLSTATDQASTQIPTSTGGVASSTTSGNTNRTRRSSSLTQRYPGDQSHRPLDMLQHHSLRQNRSPHLRKKSHVGADSIDSLDDIMGSAYHHEGPYDATLMARNLRRKDAPVAAVEGANREALKATPREKVKDSVDRHVPLDGTAVVPPGEVGRDGRRYRYKEGEDLMRDGNPEGGAYKRWVGVQYHPNDLKGKGEPAYSIEKSLKEHKTHRRNVSEGQRGNYEMVDSPTSPNNPTQPNHHYNTANRTNATIRHRNGTLAELGDRDPSELAGKELRHRRSADAVSTASSMRVPSQQAYKDWEASSPRGAESGAGARLRKGMGSLKIGGKD